MVKIYHNPQCSKSRHTLVLLKENGIEPEITRYLDNPPSVDEIDDILGKLNFENARDLMRRGETIYKDLGLKDIHDHDALTRAMSDNPKLIERPIVIKGERAVIGRPPENVKGLI